MSSYYTSSAGHSSITTAAATPTSSSPSPALGSLNASGIASTGSLAAQFAAAGSLSTTSLLASRSAMRKKTRTIVVLGFSMVGKTALCVRYVNDRFDDSYEPTYSASYIKNLRHRSCDIELVIKDTQGVGEQEGFRPEYGLGVHGYVLVYSISSLRSFEVMKSINSKLENLIGSHSVPRVLIGNKSDLEGDGGELRQVPSEMGAALAAKWGCAFAECSARLDVNIDRAFETLLDEIERASEPEKDTLSSGLERIVSDCFSSCCRPARGDTIIDIESPSATPSLVEIAAATERWTTRTKVCAWSTMLLSVAGICFAVWLGFHNQDSQMELLSYILFGFGLIVWLASLVGLYALRTSSAEILHVFSISLGIVTAAEVAAWIFLFVDFDAFSAHPVAVSVAGAVALAVQVAACITGQKLGHAMTASNVGSPYMTEYHQSYHSLYE